MQKPATIESAESIDTIDTTDSTLAEEKVPFFARKQGRPNLTVRTGVRAGAAEEKAKRR